MEEYTTVSVLSALIKNTVEQNFNIVHLKAEVSALKTHSSGHIYFALKDANSVIDAVCWKYVALKQKIKLEDGMEIKCTGKITTYPSRSKYQFDISSFELAGIGELLKLLEDRKKKLAAEGLFDISRKKPIPFLPKTIGIITSPTGAVIKDMLHRIRARFPTNVLLWPVLVQGTDACNQITNAIAGMNNLQEKPDVIIIARGGGSFEDLMTFNDEAVVRAVAMSEIPIISAIGHETDTTLIDYAADLRAPTPTAAAEFAVPEKIKLHAKADQIFANLNLVISSNLEKNRLFLKSNKILSIQSVVNEKTQKIDFIVDRISSLINRIISNKNLLLANAILTKPTFKDISSDLFQKIEFIFLRNFEQSKNNYILAANALESNSYFNILKKGFAIIESDKKTAITSVKEIKNFTNFKITFADGEVNARLLPTQAKLDLQ